MTNDTTNPTWEAIKIAAPSDDVLRVMERMEHALTEDKPTRQERRQWIRSAKKPKALRGHP